MAIVFLLAHAGESAALDCITVSVTGADCDAVVACPGDHPIADYTSGNFTVGSSPDGYTCTDVTCPMEPYQYHCTGTGRGSITANILCCDNGNGGGGGYTGNPSPTHAPPPRQLSTSTSTSATGASVSATCNGQSSLTFDPQSGGSYTCNFTSSGVKRCTKSWTGENGSGSAAIAPNTIVSETDDLVGTIEISCLTGTGSAVSQTVYITRPSGTTKSIAQTAGNSTGSQTVSLGDAGSVSNLGANIVATDGAVDCAAGANAMAASQDGSPLLQSCLKKMQTAKAIENQAKAISAKAGTTADGLSVDPGIVEQPRTKAVLEKFEKNFGGDGNDFLKSVVGAADPKNAVSAAVGDKLDAEKVLTAFAPGGAPAPDAGFREPASFAASAPAFPVSERPETPTRSADGEVGRLMNDMDFFLAHRRARGKGAGFDEPGARHLEAADIQGGMAELMASLYGDENVSLFQRVRKQYKKRRF
jgi:hypothetical protein